jgi:hypothetical protein
MPYGGTLPYKYSWSTDDTTRSVSNLTDGFYSVIVTDKRGCTTYDQTEVTVPNSLTDSVAIVPPTCNNYSDGSIRIIMAGGKPDYTYAWKHGPQTDIAPNLGQGTYEVKVTDANGCFITREYTLANPDLLPVNVGADKVLCKDQTLQVNGSIADASAQYVWTKDGAPFSTSAVATLSDAATYMLKVTDSKGCVNQDDIKITRDETVIMADFVVATRVPKGERVRMTNISFPAPDKTEWVIPAGAEISDEKSDYLELVFDTYGEYPVGLRSFKGACEKTAYKTVKVVSKAELADYQAPDEPYIKQFMVNPNPNEGRFTATIELREAGDFKLLFYSSQGTVIAQKEIKGQSFSTVEFDEASSVSSGIYMLQLITTQGLATFKIIVNK